MEGCNSTSSTAKNMTKNIEALNFQISYMVTESLLSEDGFTKNAQLSDMMSGVTDAIKNYFGSKVDPNDKVGSFLNMIAPGAIALIFKSLGFTKIGLLFGLAMNIFNIDVKSILSSIYQKIKSVLGGGKMLTPQETQTIVNESVDAGSKQPTQEDAEKVQKLVDKSPAKDASKAFRDARIVKMALLQYESEGFEKVAQRYRYKRPAFNSSSDFFSLFNSRHEETSGTLKRVLGWIFTVALLSAGLMVGGDLVKKVLKMPNSLDGTVHDGHPTQVNPVQQSGLAHSSTQTKFKVTPGLSDPPKNQNQNIWTESISNDKSSIESMLIQFAKQVYQGLNGLDNTIRATPGFQVISDRITEYNHQSAGNTMVIIPPYFTTKKQIVDFFIDDVAQKAG